MPEKLAEELERMAEEEGVSRSELVRLITECQKVLQIQGF